MLAFYITNQLPKYENDPAVVWAMREACHKNLYAIAHSCGMNGIGADTVIKATTPKVIILVYGVAAVAGLLFVFMLVLWTKGKGKWKKTEAYLNYKTMANALKAEKKAK
jgi:beta-glucosidase